MAIQKDMLNERFGNLVSDAYIKFAYFRWSDVDQKAMANFSVWATPTAEADGMEAMSTFEIDVTSMFQNIQPQMYAALKALPEWSDAVDV